MEHYYDDDDDVDILRVRQRRPSPFLYNNRPLRPVYVGPAGQVQEVAGGRSGRSRSHERRAPPPAQAPVIINKIYNDHDDRNEDYDDDDRLYIPVAAPVHHRSRSRPRSPRSPPARDPYRELGYMSREYELERTRNELEKYKLQAQREEDERLMRKELELKRLREEKKAEEEKKRARDEVERTRDPYRDPYRDPHRDTHTNPKYMTAEDYELERTRKELEKYKLQERREEDERLMKKELELKRLREEKKAEEEKRRAKEEAERAVKEWKAKEEERKAKEKKEKEEREQEYRKRLEEDLKRSNLDDRQIAIILNKEDEKAQNRPTYTRMARRFLSIETLNAFRIDYTLDPDPEYILIKRWVPEYEQDALWRHTKELRDRRIAPPTFLAIEDTHHYRSGHKEVEYEIVKKERRRRSKSPGGLVTFFAGAKRV